MGDYLNQWVTILLFFGMDFAYIRALYVFHKKSFEGMI